jgi:hypothetical protein
MELKDNMWDGMGWIQTHDRTVGVRVTTTYLSALPSDWLERSHLAIYPNRPHRPRRMTAFKPSTVQ